MSDHSTAGSAETDFKSCRSAALAIASVVFMAGLDGTIVNISLPTMERELQVGHGVISWVVLIYLLMYGALLLFFGKLADRIGLKRVFVSGIAVFTGASLFCGLSSTLPVLLAGRCIQGIGVSMLTVTAFALIPRIFPPRFTGTGFGILTTAAAAGTTIGAPLGGWIAGGFSWHWIFLINIPIGVAAFVNTCRVLPADAPQSSHAQQRSVPLDIPGVILSFTGLFCLLYSISQIHNLGGKSLLTISCFIAGSLLLVLFVLREKRCSSPLLHLELLKIRPLRLSILAGIAAYSFLAGMIFLIPFYLEGVLRLSTGRSGLVMMGYSIPLIFAGPYAGTLAGRIGSRRLCVGGMLLAAAACLIFSMTLQSPSFIPVLTFLIFSGTAFGFFNSPNNNHVSNAVPKEYQGEVFGMMQTAVRTSMAIGVSIFGVLFFHALAQDPALPVHAYRLVFLVGAFFCLGAALLSNKAMKIVG